MDRKHNKALNDNAKALRKNMTKEEQKLWYGFLRSYPVKFLRQKILGRYIVDFYSASAKLVVELDGGQHFSEEGLKYDCQRSAYLEQYGIKVIRVANNDIWYHFDGVCKYIDEEVKKRGQSPCPPLHKRGKDNPPCPPLHKGGKDNPPCPPLHKGGKDNTPLHKGEERKNMNQDWAEKNKEVQTLLGKEKTYKDGIEKLIELRADLFQQFTYMMNNLPGEAFYKMPFAGANGYHSKTIAYSFWHIFRIEDIVCHEMIAGDKQVLFAGDYAGKIGATILTTGNELQGEEIVLFSEKLNMKALHDYCKAVMDSSNEIIRSLTWTDLKRKFTDEDKNKLHKTGSVSEDPNAVWLIDYWCSKDVRGLLKMPFSRHWIMHIEAARRISDKLCRLARTGRGTENT